jgi:phosphonatase-like hydrolase
MLFKMIVFDLAGTTVEDNRDVHRVLISAIKKHGIIVTTEQANDVMGIPKPIAIRQLLVENYSGTNVISDEWISEIHHDFIDEMKNFYRFAEEVAEKKGVSDTFEKLKSQGLKIAVDTGFDRSITDALLARMGWHEKKLIDVSVTSDEVPRGRPFPDMVYKAMKVCAITDSSQVIKVGDTASDIQEGRAAGCGLVIGITSGAFTPNQLSLEKPDHLISQVSELLPLII